MLGVRSLSIGLSIALVVCTGVLVGTLSITTGQKTTADAREAGDRGVAATLASGDKDIRQMSARYLKATTEGVETRMAEVLGKAETAALTLKQFGEMVDPKLMTGNGTNEYLDGMLRMAMRQVLAANYPVISAVHYRWGINDGVMSHFTFDQTQAYSPNADDLWAVLETQPFPFGAIGASDYTAIGSADGRGRMINMDKPCFLYSGRVPDVSKDMFGMCVLPKATFFPNDARDLAMMMGNAQLPEDSGKPVLPSTVSFGETFPSLVWMLTGVHVPVEHPKHIQPGAVRHVNRLGFFTVSLEMSYVSDVLRAAAVPAGTILYCVEKSPWTASVGMLIATNYGQLNTETEVIIPGLVVNFTGLVQISAVNHTFDANTTELSPIAHHARHIFAAFPTHYEDAAVATNDRGEFLEWTLPTNGTADGATNATTGTTTTTYWYTVLHMKYANLNWYISMLVPRSSIMDAIDASVAAVQAQREQDKEDADEFEKRSLLITVVVTVVVACVLMGVSAVVTNKILSPLMGLERDMACVAVMNVEAVDLGGEMSALSEVRGMEESFRTMVKNLVEYKQYMPQSVLVTDTEEEDDIDVMSRVSGLSAGTSASQQRSDSMTPANRALREAMRNALASATDLRRRQITITAFNIRGFLAAAATMTDAALQETYTGVLSALVAAMKQYRGVCDTFAGDRFIVAHNAFVTQATHKVSAVDEALQVRDRVEHLSSKAATLSVSFAACSGEARVGQMGCTGMKKVTIMSGVVPWAAALETYNKVRGYGGVVDGYVAEDAGPSLKLRKTDVAVYPKMVVSRRRSAGPKALEIYEVAGARNAHNDEWMYQMENSTSKEDPYVKWNTMFDDLVAGRTEAAKEALEGMPRWLCEPAEHHRVQAMIALGRCDPVALDTAASLALPAPATPTPDGITTPTAVAVAVMFPGDETAAAAARP